MIDKRRYRLQEGNILIDFYSGKKIVLDEPGLMFFDVYERYGKSDRAIDEISSTYEIPNEVAKTDYEEFLNDIFNDDECHGSILPFDNYFVLEPTSACSGNCVHCFHKNKETHSWDENMVENVLEFLINNKVKSVSITGGEVFSTHYVENLFYLIKKLKNSNIKVASISTNGIFIDETILEKIKINIDKTTVFRFSMDAYEIDKVKEIRPGYKNKDLFKPILQIDNLGYKSVFTTIISNQNKEDILNIASFLSDLKNIQAWNLRPLVPTKDTHLNLVNEFLEIQEIYSAVLLNYKKVGYHFEVRLGNFISTFDLENPKSLFSYEGWHHPCRTEKNLMTLKATGQITRCPILPELSQDYNTGSISDIKKAKENIFHSLSTENMSCNKCDLYKICGGGCRLYAIAHGLGEDGCDINSRMTIEWILQDKDNLFKTHWNNYYDFMREVISDEN